VAINYIVVLDKEPDIKPEKPFPRGYHYMKDALKDIGEVELQEGKAHLVPKSQFSMGLLEQLAFLTAKKMSDKE
jgi:hypothetical protein